MKKYFIILGLLFSVEALASQNSFKLISAAREGNVTTVQKELLDNQADPNSIDKFNKTALMYAAYLGHTDVVRVLLEAGADIDLVDSEGWNVLFYAVVKNREVISALLVNQGVDTTLVDLDGKQAIDYAKNKGFFSIQQIIREGKNE